MNLPPLVYVAGICLAYLLLRPTCTIVHESGHLLYLLVTGQPGQLRVFIGSLGEGKRSWRIRTGRILWLFHPIGFLLRGSITDHDRALPSRQILPYALAGPVASLLLAATCLVIVVAGGGLVPAWLRALAGMPMLLALLDTALSLLHRRDPQPLSCETMTGNDGQLIGWRMQFGRWTADYLHAQWLFEQERYAEAQVIYARMHGEGCRQKALLEYLISCELALGNASSALDWHGRMVEQDAADADDHWRSAVALVALGRLEAAMGVIGEALHQAPGHAESLNLRAWLALGEGKHEAALEDLNQALRTPLEIGHVYANRGWAHLQAGELEAAHRDLLLATKFEAENPNLHAHWAGYFEAIGDAGQAEASRWTARLLGSGVK